MSNTFPATFDMTFADGPQTTFTGSPETVATAMTNLESVVTSIDSWKIESHGYRTITAIVFYTP